MHGPEGMAPKGGTPAEGDTHFVAGTPLPSLLRADDLISAGLDFFGDRKKNALNQ